MKVLLLNGSTRKDGCVYTALSEVASVLNEEGIKTEILQMGTNPIYDCMGCDFCQRAHGGSLDEFMADVKHNASAVFQDARSK